MISIIGMENVAYYEAELTECALSRLSGISKIQFLDDLNPIIAAKRLGVTTFRIEGVSPLILTTLLNQKSGIRVGNGLSYAYTNGENLSKMSTEKVLEYNSFYYPIIGLICLGWSTHLLVSTIFPDDVDALVDAPSRIIRGEYPEKYN